MCRKAKAILCSFILALALQQLWSVLMLLVEVVLFECNCDTWVDDDEDDDDIDEDMRRCGRRFRWVSSISNNALGVGTTIHGQTVTSGFG